MLYTQELEMVAFKNEGAQSTQPMRKQRFANICKAKSLSQSSHCIHGFFSVEISFP